MISTTSINIDEFKELLVHTINNNKFLQENNKVPLAIAVEGIAGLGKTSIVEQTAAELGLEFAELNLAEIDEISELIGFPIRQFQLCKNTDNVIRKENYTETIRVPKKVVKTEKQAKTVNKQVKTPDGKFVIRPVTVMEDVQVETTEYVDEIINKTRDTLEPFTAECLWVDEHAISEYTKQGYAFTGQKRMSYCLPEWIAGKGENGIFFIDDAKRGEQRFMQSVMRLIDRQQFISWSLPKGWTIVLSNNPNDGNYQVAELDIAQETRYSNFTLKFDMECWLRYAEKSGIDGRCQNFLALNPELITEKCNPRAITNFFNSISSFEDFEKNLPMIQLLGEGSVGDEFSTMFVLFINNRLDRLISPKEILLNKDEKFVISELEGCIGKDKTYRADIASVLTTRLINFALNYAETNSLSDDVIKRLITLSTGDTLTDDLKYILVKKLINGNKQRFQRLLTDARVMSMTLK